MMRRLNGLAAAIVVAACTPLVPQANRGQVAIAVPQCCAAQGKAIAERHHVSAITSRRFTHTELWTALDPFLRSPQVTVADIGRSIQGRPIRAVTFGSGPVTVLLWSQMHGDESTATMSLADLISWFASSSPEHEPLRRELASKLKVVMIPMLNPDGAELFQRENAVGIDVNRDARNLTTPEARALKSLRDSIKPAFGFNLHDQNARTLTGNNGSQVAIALLAPAADEERTYGPARTTARLIAAVIASVLKSEIPGRLAKYSDAHEPRAFGDLMQQWGTSTVLIESGAMPDDAEKQKLRTINVVAILSALNAMAGESWHDADPEAYESIPTNSRSAVDLLVRGASVVLPGAAPIRADLALNYEEPVARREPRVVQVGDLARVIALDTLDVAGMYLHPDQAMLTDRGGKKWIRFDAAAMLTVRKGPDANSEMVRVIGDVKRAPLSDADVDEAGKRITVDGIMRRIGALADDSMLGRGPGQRGDTVTVEYLAREFERIGLAPGGAYGYRQPVELFRASTVGELRVHGSSRLAMAADSQVTLRSTSRTPVSIVNAPMVFVGYGVDAPELRWDDYKGVDLSGKVAVALEGEPEALLKRGFAPNAFGTYHGMTFVKGQRARDHGAVGLIVVRGAADSVHARRATRFQHSYLIGSVPTAAEPSIVAHLSKSAGGRLARASGSSFDRWQKQSADSAFMPIPIRLLADANVHVRTAPFTSHNIVGVIPGSDPELSRECVVYVAHWDGYGIGPAVRRGAAMDSIYNGALDDAAGVSVMLSIAEAMRALPVAPRRTTVFIATTAEESGLLGANAYVADPVCPMSRTTLAIGMDWTWTWGRTGSITSNGFGYSTVDSIAAPIARRMGMTFGPGWSDYWTASDHAAFLAHGVPAWFGGLDGEVIGKPKGWALEQLMGTATHVPSDEILSSWDMRGAVEEARFLLALGVHAAESADRPQWTVDSEFRRARQKSLQPQ
jgi:hypothetical protein